MPAISLPCSRCGRFAAQLTLPRIPSNLMGFVGAIVAMVNLKMRSAGIAPLVVPKSGEVADAIPAEQLPALAAALDVVCAECHVYRNRVTAGAA